MRKNQSRLKEFYLHFPISPLLPSMLPKIHLMIVFLLYPLLPSVMKGMIVHCPHLLLQ
jgi:hypothetical protein